MTGIDSGADEQDTISVTSIIPLVPHALHLCVSTSPLISLESLATVQNPPRLFPNLTFKRGGKGKGGQTKAATPKKVDATMMSEEFESSDPETHK